MTSNGFQPSSASGAVDTPGEADGTPTPAHAQHDNTANLLNLLKFSTPTPSAARTPNPDTLGQSSSAKPNHGNAPNGAASPSVHGRGISASDLVASFMGKPSRPATPPAPPKNPPPRSSSSSHQDFLLKLLNQSTADVATPSNRNKSPLRVFGTDESGKATPFQPENMPSPTSATKKDPIFTYVNPFDHLAASSPRHKRTPASSSERRSSPNVRQPSALQEPPLHSNTARDEQSSAPKSLPDGRSQIEALMGIGAPTKDPETVAQALEEVADKADKQAERALEDAEAQEDNTQVVLEEMGQKTLNAMRKELQEAATDVKKELGKKENTEVLNEVLTAPVAGAVKDIIDDAAQDSGGDEWTSTDERGRDNRESDPIVPTFQFPHKPFVSLELEQTSPANIHVRDASIIEVTKFKKDFDQIDRTLAAASNDYIVYSSVKPGGFRMLRQEDGRQQLLFRGTGDRIFNLALSTTRVGSPSHGTNAVIATGVSGTVYWVEVGVGDDSAFETSAMESNGLVFPPLSSQGDGPSTGQLKTRAKRSSRHPEFFAIGRGKYVQIVFPSHARQSSFLGKDRILDTDRYFQDRNLKINTGKASKDFCFSEDDTVIFTINKAARLQLWNVQELVHKDNATASRLAAIEVKTPVLSYVTASPSDKTWPTSVMCVDKVRPYLKGAATRYVIVGMRQNHTLQLWDLMLGKAVQELSLPHSDDMDAMCSVCYHPASGMIVIGHPTRNSVYFIHLSTPRYNLPVMSQVKFVERLANKDPSLPKPEATSIMSDLREVSLARLGQLRSIDLLPSSGESLKRTEDSDESTTFELYVTHSRGVDCISMRKDDLGWSPDGKTLRPIKAEEEGMLFVKELYGSRLADSGDGTPNGTATPSIRTPTVSQAKLSSKEENFSSPVKAMKARHTEKKANIAPIPSPTPKVGTVPEALTVAEGSAKKKKNKKVNAAENTSSRELESHITDEPIASGEPSEATYLAPKGPNLASAETLISSPDRTPATSNQKTMPVSNGDLKTSAGILSDVSDHEYSKTEVTGSGEVIQLFKQELEELYRKIEQDKQVHYAASDAKQKALLGLMAEVLATNVEKSLNHIAQNHNQKEVIPALSKVTRETIEKNVSEVVVQQFHIVPPHLKQIMPDAISKALQSPGILDGVASKITASITNAIEKQLTALNGNVLVPKFQSIFMATEKSNSAVSHQVHDQISRLQKEHREDNIKIEQLTNLVRELSETVKTMATAQSDFQQEILKLQEQATQERQAAAARHTSQHPQAETSRPVSQDIDHAGQQMSLYQSELDTITALVRDGRYEEASITWLQSEQKQHLFTNFFVRVSTAFVHDLAPLISLSIAALVTDGFETATHLMERLNWLEAVLMGINPRDPDVRGVMPQILDVLVQRLEHGYMAVAERTRSGDAGIEDVLRRIPGLARRARDLKGFVV